MPLIFQDPLSSRIIFLNDNSNNNNKMSLIGYLPTERQTYFK